MESQRIEMNGALRLILYVSRLVGLAPLKMKRESDGWRVTVSNSITIIGFNLMVLLHAGIVAALIMDWNLANEQAVRMQSNASRFVVILEVSVTASIVTIGVYNAKSRMENVLKCLGIVQKIQNQTVNYKVSTTKRCIWIMICVFISNCNLAKFLNTNISEAIEGRKNVTIVCLYLCFYFEYLIVCVLVLQFICVAFVVNTGFESINDTFQDLIDIADLRKNDFNFGSKGFNNKIGIPKKSINFVTDNLDFKNIINAEQQNGKESVEIVRHLTVCYRAMCDVVRQIDECYGNLTFLIFGTHLIYLLAIPCNILAYLKTADDEQQDDVPWELILEALNYFIIVIYMCIVVEPAQNMGNEVDRIQMLLSHVLCRVTSEEPLYLQLHLMYKQIELNEVTYSPLGLIELKRGLILSLFGTALIFMIVILQYQLLDQQNV